MIKITNSTRILLIILASVVVYANSLNAKFAWDDMYLIVENPYIKNWHNTDIVFKKHLYYGANKLSNYYRPLQPISYMVDYSIWRLNPFGYHLTNIALHTINAILVYIIILAISGLPDVSFLAALLFSTAPVISSAVYYISSRADLLAAMFMLISTSAFIEYHRKRKRPFYIISLLSFILALLSRENAVILPFLLMVVFYQNKERDLKRFLKGISLFFFVLIIYVLLRLTIFNFYSGWHWVYTYITDTSLFKRLLTDFKVLVIYLRLLLFPFSLHMERFVKPAGSVLQLDIVFSMLFIVLAGMVVKKLSRAYPVILFGVAWFFVTLFPVLNIYPLSTFLHEAWLYLPSIGFFLILAVILLKVTRKRTGYVISHVFIAILLLYFIILSILHGRVWRDNVSLFRNSIKYNADSPYIYLSHSNLALSYFHNGNIDDAIKECNYALSLNPKFSGGYNNLGIFYSAKGEFVKAVKKFKIAIKREPNSAPAYLNISIAYNRLGHYTEALKAVTKCIRLSPYYYKPYCTMGLIYFNMNEFKKAERSFNKALQLNRDSFEAHYLLASLYFKKGDLERALKEYEHCLRFDDKGAGFYNSLGMLYIRLGRLKEAEDSFMHAKGVDDRYISSYNNLGNLYGMLKMFDFAIDEYKEALRVQPDNVEIRVNLARTYKDLYKDRLDRLFYYKAWKEWRKAFLLALRQR